MKDALDFLSNDWQKIPQNYRYLLLSGFFFIFNAWLIDHWTDNAKFLGSLVALINYIVGMTLVVFGFGFLVAKQVIAFINIFRLRRRYPAKKANKDFFIISFGDPWYLFDKKTMLFYHVEPWKTVETLKFELLVIKTKGIEFQYGVEMKIQYKKDKWVEIDKYTYAGKINTTI